MSVTDLAHDGGDDDDDDDDGDDDNDDDDLNGLRIMTFFPS